ITRPGEKHRDTIRVLITATTIATENYRLLKLLQNTAAFLLYSFQRLRIFILTKLVDDQPTLAIEQLTEVAQIDILIVHVRLALPMHVQNRALRLPIDATLRIFEALNQRFSEVVERISEIIEATQIPRSHINRHAADRIRVLAVNELLHE